MSGSRKPRRPDDGSVLPLVLVLIVVGALIVIPVMTYSISVLRANQVEQEKTRNVEAAKGAVRTALRQPGLIFGDKDRANAACPDDDADLLPAGGEVVTDISVSIDCTPVSELSANQVFGFEVPVGAAQLQIAPAPSGFADFSGVLASSPEAPPYPSDGVSPSWAWWQSFSWTNPEDPGDIKSIWIPDLPTFIDESRTSSPLDMPGFDCKVFLPGRYEDPLTIDASGSIDNYYFASGVYYFEQPVTIAGDVDVVVGQGLADFGVTNDCADDIQVGANVSVPSDTVYAIDGNSGGATWVFGDEGRLAISDVGGAPSVRFNQRYATQDRGGWINIASVNGDWSWDEGDAVYCDADDDCFEDANGDHTATNVNHVDRSQVVVRDVDDTLDIVELGEPGALYIPSHPDLTDEAQVPEPPTAVAGAAVIAGGASIEVVFRGVEGARTNGAIVTEYEAGVQVGGGSTPTPNPTSTCTTAGGDPALVPTVEGVDGADLWGRAHPENAGDPDQYSCLITGLTAGQTYWVTARARNEAGWSGWATPSQVPSSAWGSPPVAAPADAPGNVVVVPYDDDPALPDAALVSWDASASTNGAPITGYDVQLYRVFLQDEATTTTTSTTTTTTSTTTTSTTLPPVGTSCGPPFDCASIPACPSGREAIALYVDDAWEWSCEPSCPSGGTLITVGATTDCAPAWVQCDSDERPERRNFVSWRCRNLELRNNRVSHGYGIPNTRCPSGTSPRFGFGTGYCAVNGPQPFRSALPQVVAPQQEPDPGTTTTTNPITYVEVEEYLNLADMRCSTEPRMGRTPQDAGLEWTPPPTQCVIPNLPPLPTTDGDGRTNVGYRVKVTARTPVGSSAPATFEPPFMALTGTPGSLDPLPPERVWFPYYDTSIISIDASNGGNTVVDIPGYVSVPMGRITIANPGGDDVNITGGVVAGRFEVTDSRSPLPYGYVPSVVMQRTVRLTATAGNIESTALVKVNSDTSYGVVRWVTQ